MTTMSELTAQEVDEVAGGMIGLGIALAIFAIGYQIGKDLAEQDRRNQS